MSPVSPQRVNLLKNGLKTLEDVQHVSSTPCSRQSLKPTLALIIKNRSSYTRWDFAAARHPSRCLLVSAPPEELLRYVGPRERQSR